MLSVAVPSRSFGVRPELGGLRLRRDRPQRRPRPHHDLRLQHREHRSRSDRTDRLDPRRHEVRRDGVSTECRSRSASLPTARTGRSRTVSGYCPSGEAAYDTVSPTSQQALALIEDLRRDDGVERARRRSTTSTTRRPYSADGKSCVMLRRVWFGEGRSAEARLRLAGRLGIQGIAVWRFGDEDPALWRRSLAVAKAITPDPAKATLAAPEKVVAQQPLSLTGRFTVSGLPVVDGAVSVQKRVPGGAWKTVSALVSDATGRARYDTTAVRTLEWRMRLAADVGLEPVADQDRQGTRDHDDCEGWLTTHGAPTVTPLRAARRHGGRGRCRRQHRCCRLLPTPAGAADDPPPKRYVTGWLPYWNTQAATSSVVKNTSVFQDASPFVFDANSTRGIALTGRPRRVASDAPAHCARPGSRTSRLSRPTCQPTSSPGSCRTEIGGQRTSCARRARRTGTTSTASTSTMSRSTSAPTPVGRPCASSTRSSSVSSSASCRSTAVG